MKSKFSVSVDEELCRWLDAEVKNRRFASRSHGIEFSLSEIMKKNGG